MAGSSASFSGSLQTKKKAELQEIAQALKLKDTGTRDELQTRIKSHLDENTDELEENPTFAGLYNTRKRQRSLQAQEIVLPSRNVGRGRMGTLKEQREPSPAAPEDLADVSVLLPSVLHSPPKSAYKPLLMASPPATPSAPVVPSPAPSPTKSVLADALSQPEVRAVVEMERGLAKSTKAFLIQTRETLSDAGLIFVIMACLEFTGIAYKTYTTVYHPSAPPASPSSIDPVTFLQALAHITFHWTLPTVVLPAIAGFLISFNRDRPANSFAFNPLTAAITCVAANLAYSFPAPEGPIASITSTDVLGVQLRVWAASLNLAFAVADAIGRRPQS